VLLNNNRVRKIQVDGNVLAGRQGSLNGEHECSIPFSVASRAMKALCWQEWWQGLGAVQVAPMVLFLNLPKWVPAGLPVGPVRPLAAVSACSCCPACPAIARQALQ
jgi:hypothetical protein